MPERQSPFVETCEHCRCPRDSEARNTRVRAVYEKHLFFLLWWKALAPHFHFKYRLSINSRSRTAWLCSSSRAKYWGESPCTSFASKSSELLVQRIARLKSISVLCLPPQDNLK